jgi:hypothetical protein
MPARIDDPADPDFPHGTATGYAKGCHRASPCPATPTCTTAHRRLAKLARARRLGVVAPGPTTRVPAAGLSGHIRTLMAAPGTTLNMIATVSGTHPQTVRACAEGRGRISRAAAEKIRATTPAMMGDTLIPATPKLIQLLRSMQAQGWSRAWQGRQLGCHPDTLGKIARGGQAKVAARLAARVAALAREVEAKQGPSRSAAIRARNAGWHPLAAYDEDGELIPCAVRDERVERRKADRYRAAHDRLEVLRLSLGGMAPSDIETRTGVKHDLIQRTRAEAGLRFYTENGTPWSAQLRRSTLRPDPDNLKRAEEVRALLDAFYRDSLADAYKTALAIGLRKGLKAGQPLGETAPPQTGADEVDPAQVA